MRFGFCSQVEFEALTINVLFLTTHVPRHGLRHSLSHERRREQRYTWMADARRSGDIVSPTVSLMGEPGVRRSHQDVGWHQAVEVAAERRKKRGPGRPPLPVFTLTEPKKAPWGPGQRETFIAVLAEIILNEYYRQWRAERGLPERHEPTLSPELEEDAGQHPGS